MGLLNKLRNNGADAIIEKLTSKAAKGAPATHEAGWGSDGVNCYAWAANCEKPFSGKPDPGRFSNMDAKAAGKFTAEKLIAGARADGMFYGANVVESKPLGYLEGYYTVALYLSKNGADHHWYRCDPLSGRWTHKPGARDICNYGPGFSVITAALAQSNHNYGKPNTNYQFVAYFYVPKEGIEVG
jgi:hypothetical protein